DNLVLTHEVTGDARGDRAIGRRRPAETRRPEEHQARQQPHWDMAPGHSRVQILVTADASTADQLKESSGSSTLDLRRSTLGAPACLALDTPHQSLNSRSCSCWCGSALSPGANSLSLRKTISM